MVVVVMVVAPVGGSKESHHLLWIGTFLHWIKPALKAMKGEIRQSAGGLQLNG